MNKIILSIPIILLSFFSVNAQEEVYTYNKNIRFGFILGVNYSNLNSPNEIPDSISIYNDFGAKIGLLMESKLNENFYFSPKVEMNFNQSGTEYSRNEGSYKYFHAFPISLNFCAHLVYKFSDNDMNPYILLGPNLRSSFRDPDQLNSDFKKTPDFAIDFGFGIDKELKHFVFAPEIRYSAGILNVSNSAIIDKMYFHNFSLAFNFK